MNWAARQWWRLVRFGFRLLYNEFAFTYDAVSTVVSLGQWRCWQRRALDHLPESSAGPVLEIAHGTGNLHFDLKTAGYSVYGYDLSAQMGRITRHKMLRNGYDANLARGYAQQLPFASNHFAAVVSTFPTDFIVAPATLREVYRVLQPDGVLVVVLNGELTGQGILARFIEWLYSITGQREGDETNVGQFFEGYGFDVTPVTAECPSSRVQLVVLRK